MVMRQGLTVTLAGLGAGTALASLAACGVSSALYGVSAFDLVAWTGAVTALLGSATLANYLPARRASLVDPSIALKTE